MWIAWICCLYCLLIVQFVIAIRLLLGGCMYLWFAMALCKYVLTNTLTDCYMVILRSFLRTNDWIINTSLLISVTVDVACATAFMQRSGCPSVCLAVCLSHRSAAACGWFAVERRAVATYPLISAAGDHSQQQMQITRIDLCLRIPYSDFMALLFLTSNANTSLSLPAFWFVYSPTRLTG